MNPCISHLATLPIILALSHSAAGAVPPLPVHEATGSNYQIGFSIGQRFKDQIVRSMQNNTFFTSKVLPHNKTQDGAALYAGYLHTAESLYPQYVDEVRGMADGAKIAFDKLFLWNMQLEYDLLLRPSTEESQPLPASGCSDLYVLDGTGQALMGHNEDGDILDLVTGYMVNASLSNGDRFLAYCFPGQLCGKAFGYNFVTQTAFSCNVVFPTAINTTAIGRNFLNRALLSLSYSEIVRTLKDKELFCSSGFSLNVGWRDSSGGFVTSNFEISSEGAVETQYKSGYGYHFNMYLHTPDSSQHTHTSSQHRLARIKELPSVEGMEDILSYLGDTKHSQYPVYRCAAPPDDLTTLATVLFDLSNSMLHIFRGNPSTTQPVMTIPLGYTSAVPYREPYNMNCFIKREHWCAA